MDNDKNTSKTVVQCEKCDKKYRVPKGKKFKCKKCGKLIIVPRDDAEGTPQPEKTAKARLEKTDMASETPKPEVVSSVSTTPSVAVEDKSSSDDKQKEVKSEESKEPSSVDKPTPSADVSEKETSSAEAPPGTSKPEKKTEPERTIEGEKGASASREKAEGPSKTNQPEKPIAAQTAPDSKKSVDRLERKLNEKDTLVNELREQLASLRQRSELLEDELRQYRNKDKRTDEEIEKANIQVDPLDKEKEIASLRKKKDRIFVQAFLSDGDTVYMISKTGTRVDTGGWLLGSKMWLLVTEKGVLLAARGRKKYIHRLEFTDIGDVVWNGITKRVVIKERDSDMPISLKLTNTEAKKIISIVEGVNVCGK